MVLGVFIAGNIVSIFATNFTIALIARVVPAFFHPIYCSLAFTVAAASTSQEEAPMALISAWGILGGIGGNINQYWISTAAPEAPDFANGLFLTAANLGTTLGATVCGYFISGLGIKYVVLGGLLFSLLSIVFIFIRIYMCSPGKPSSVMSDMVETGTN